VAAKVRARVPARRSFVVLAALLIVSAIASTLAATGANAQSRQKTQLTSTATSTLPAPSGSGVYVGAGSPTVLSSFSTWRGRKANFAVDYLATDSWSNIERPTWWLNQWKSTGTTLVLGVPMLIDDPSTTLAEGAKGTYDVHFKTLAQTLVSNGYGAATLRVGWEMNGDWYRWSAKSNPTAWITYYRRIVSTMRSVSGQKFTFDWTMNLGASAMPAEAAYPGDAYVSYVGVDAYDWRWGDSTITPQDRWKWILGQSYGLEWVAQFAAAHGKRVAVPEWGLAETSAMSGGGGGDDPYYIRSMLDWTRAHNVIYEAYFNWNTHRLDTGLYPASASEYRTAVNM
jgi:hypothetical protein